MHHIIIAVLSHNFTHKVGYIGKGGDVTPPKAVTLAEAERICGSEPMCKGITFEAPDKTPAGTIPKVYFKRHTDVMADSSWHTYLRDYTPPPPMLQNPCLQPASGQTGLPWCNHTLPVAARVADMISRMSVKEKITQLGTSSPAVPSLSRARQPAVLLLFLGLP